MRVVVQLRQTVGLVQWPTMPALPACSLQKVLRGFNGTVFAYGQTGSGKTYTMEGAPDAPGVVPQLCVQLFAHRQAEMHRTAFTIKASYIEIYQETLRDLLGSSTFERRPSGAGATATPLTVTDAGDEQGSGSRPVIREHPVTGVFLDNVVEHTVMSYEDIAAIIAMGTSRRTKGHTKMNAVSSRSHAVLSLFIEQQDVQDNDGLTRLTSQLNLCDLAGSERAKATGATGTAVCWCACSHLAWLACMVGGDVGATVTSQACD